MATLNIQVSRAGIDKITADTASVADVREAGELIQATGLATRLLHQSVIEHFAADCPPAKEPRVWLPSFEDGLQDRPRELKILVNNGGRDLFKDPPQWFVDSMKTTFPSHPFWQNAESVGESETAVMVFRSVAPWLDHAGFCGTNSDENSQDILIAEPYSVSMTQIVELISFFEKLGWVFSITGRSAHYPSATIRLEIKPKENTR